MFNPQPRTKYHESEVCNFNCLGGIQKDINGDIHLFLLKDDNESIADELVLQGDGAKAFLSFLESEFNLRKQGHTMLA